MSTLLDQARNLLAEARTQFDSRFGDELVLTDRVKTYIAIVAGVLLLSLYVALSHVVDRARALHNTAQVSYTRLKTQAESGSWAARRSESQAVKLALEERLWVANTPGLAEAEYERWLRERLSRYKIEPQQIQVRRVPVATGPDAAAKGVLANVERMSAKILMPFDQVGLLSFLDDVAESNRALVIDRLIVRTGRNARVEMDVVAFFPARERSR